MLADGAPRRTSSLVVGVGAATGATAAEIEALVRGALGAAGLPLARVRAVATVDRRADAPAVVALAARLGVPVRAYAPHELAAVPVPRPSRAPRAALGTGSVAEAAALAEAGGRGRLLVAKQKSARATCAVAEDPREGRVMPSYELRHHGDAEVRGAGLTDLAVNVRAGTPPAWLRERLADALGSLAAYPDDRAARAAVAARHGLAPERVLLTAGAAEAFVLLARTLPVRRPVVVHPQFTEPEAALRAAGHAVERVVLREEDGFRLDPALVPAGADLVVLGNPTNPTSVLHPADVIASLARPGRTLVVDEAFVDTVPGERESLASRTDVPGLLVLRSLTKTWGLAGLRIGYVLGAPATLARLARAQPLWPVSTPALVAAEACSAPGALAEAEAAARDLAGDRDFLAAGLAELPGARVVGPAAASFLLVRLPDAARLRERLRGAGWAVRRGDTFPGLGDEWLRVAVRDRGTSERFLAAVRGVVGAEVPGAGG
ncbi:MULTISPECIES: Rv2231c family pyridoxal phosphate-dependent protein CobC [unclassified Streptomyces]|uniref:Rv2231c family pyridoxal phosphate-dependent protein CobC n=1 Tax=unclassified Streptomyces TaxID=2593676 RepID=UPI00364EE729